MVWIGISILSISVQCQPRNRTQKHAKNLSKTYHWLRLAESNWYCQLRETSPGTAKGSESCVCCIQKTSKTKWREKVKQPIGKLSLSECSLLFNIQHIEKLLTKSTTPRLTLSSQITPVSHTWHEAGLFHIMSFIVEVITRTGSTSKCLNRRSVLQIEFGAQFKGKLTQIDLLQPQGNGQGKVCYPKWHAWQLGNDTLKG